MQLHEHNWPRWQKKTEKRTQHCLRGEPRQPLAQTVTAKELGKVEENVTLSETLTSKADLSPSRRAYKYDIHFCPPTDTHREVVGVVGSY